MIRQADRKVQDELVALTLILLCLMFAGLSGCAQLRGPGGSTSAPSPSGADLGAEAPCRV